MATNEPIEAVPTNALGTVFSGALVIAAIIGGMVAVVAANDVAGLLGTGTAVGAVATFVGVTALVIGGLTVLSLGQEAQFYRDRVEYTGGTLGTGAASVDYDDVELVVQETRAGDRLFGTESLTLVRPNGSNVDLWYLKDPEAAVRVLGDRVAPPEEQIRAVSERHRPDHLWYHWPEDTDPPAEPVIEDEELADVLEVDVADLKLDAIDEAADLDDFSDLGDLADVAGDVGADAGGDGGDGGGGGGE